jgi:hypothetical protein
VKYVSRNWIKFSALVLCLPLAACSYGDGDDAPLRRGTDPDPLVPVRGASAVIDTDSGLEVTPGEGVGLFVEYESGGRWRLFMTCDTDISGFGCEWDIVVAPTEGVIEAITADRLEFEDFLDFWGSDGARLVTLTAYDVDGALFDAPPGAGLVVDALLDDAFAHRYIYWVGDGAVHGGAPGSPLELSPSEP